MTGTRPRWSLPPLVVPPVNGVQEIVGEDEAGSVVARDAASIAEALLVLGRDGALRANKGAVARSRIAGNTLDGNIERTLRIYRDLLPPELASGLAGGTQMCEPAGT
jgi:glycosyltransferase involved in cell wall biosynthesis